MQLSPHFSLEELTFSETAARLGLDNTPTPRIVENLKFLAEQMEGVRELLGSPIQIASGYRSAAVDLAIRGGVVPVRGTQHAFGLAADFTARAFGPPEAVCQKIAASAIPFDQLILEFGNWTHVSFVRANQRREALTIYANQTTHKPGPYLPGILTRQEYIWRSLSSV
jgi:zinc D-Ala-D-Ala carboxypeptidase